MKIEISPFVYIEYCDETRLILTKNEEDAKNFEDVLEITAIAKQFVDISRVKYIG